MTERIGIVGVGRMGLAMAKHMMKAGYAVTACDVDPDHLNQARAAGAATVAAPAARAWLRWSGLMSQAVTA